jgi:hypothetical protein
MGKFFFQTFNKSRENVLIIYPVTSVKNCEARFILLAISQAAF